MRRWPLLTLALVVACGSGGTNCPLIGCISALTVEVPSGTTAATACAGEVCTSDLRGTSLQVPLSRRGEVGDVDVRVELVGADGVTRTAAGEAALVVRRPNGPNCAPVCVSGAVRVTDDGLVDVPDAPPPTPDPAAGRP